MNHPTKSVLGLLAIAGIAGAAITQVQPGSVKAGLPGLKTGRVTGTVLSVYNSPATFKGIQRGLGDQGFRLLRFPNGSMSNWYHWNGEGKRDSAGIWHPDPVKVGPGILTLSRYRGTTQAYAGASFYSRVTDGDTASFWWSDPVGAGEPYVQLNFGADSLVDSVRIAWGELRPDSVVVGMLANPAWNGFSGTGAHLVELAKVPVAGSSTNLKIAATSMQFLVVKPLGLPAKGVQIAEVEAWNRANRVTVGVSDPTRQTPVIAMGAHPGNDGAPNWPTPPAWDFQAFVDYVQEMKDVEPMICVNYGTGTVEEAAAWVHYANVEKKLGIKFWQVGNEMDGVWEEGGPVTSTQYATKFLAFARAMKSVDPSIQVFGPVLSTSEFATTSSFQLDTTLWVEEFLRQVGQAETKDGMRYLDGFDYHAYPYWTEGVPSTISGLTAVRNIAERLDTLQAMMARHLADPGSRLVNMSELNWSVVSSSQIVRAENTVATALSLAQLVQAAGGNAMSIVWEGYNGGSTGSSANGGTWGSLSLFNEPRSGAEATQPFVPSAAYWGNWAISRLWAIDSAKPLTANVTGSSRLAAFGLVLGSDTSWLLLNTDTRVCTTMVQGVSSGWVYTFSGSNFGWTGTTDQAFAFPNAGPSGRPVAAGWDGRVVVPALGLAVVRKSAPPAASISEGGRLVNLVLRRNGLEITDTVRLSGTWLRGLQDAPPRVEIGDTSLALKAIDGEWDSHEEGFTLTLPATDLGTGHHLVRLGGSDSLHLEITGVVRPNVWIDRFLDTLPASEQPSEALWSAWQAGSARVSSIVQTFPPRGSDRCLRLDVNLVQPANLGYGVFGQGSIDLDSALVSASTGIQFEYATSHAGAGTFSVGIATDTVTNYDDYTINLAKTDSVWKTARILWREVKQAGWSGVSAGLLKGRLINTLNFRVTGEGRGSFWVDNVALMGTTGDSVTRAGRRTPKDSWKTVRTQGAWILEIPAGSRLSFVGIDGRRQETHVAGAISRTVRYAPRHAGIVYAILETEGRTERRILPSVR